MLKFWSVPLIFGLIQGWFLYEIGIYTSDWLFYVIVIPSSLMIGIINLIILEYVYKEV